MITTVLPHLLGSEDGIYDVKPPIEKQLELGRPALIEIYLFPECFVPPEQKVPLVVHFEVLNSIVLLKRCEYFSFLVLLVP